MFHLFNDGVDGRASGNGLRLIRTYQLDVMAIPENDTVFGVGYGISGLAEMRRELIFAHHIIDAILQHGAHLPTYGDFPGEISLKVGPYVRHQGNVGLMYQERQLAWHVIGHTDDARAGDTFRLTTRTCHLGKYVVGINDIDQYLHLVHVVFLKPGSDFNICFHLTLH